MQNSAAYGPTLLRICLGIVFIAHSAYLKLVVFTMAGTVGFFESLGLPAITAYGVVLAETLGGLMLIFGVRVREVALVLAVISFGAVWVHAGNGWLFNNQGGGWEYPLLLALACIVQFLLGAGKLQPKWDERMGAVLWIK